MKDLQQNLQQDLKQDLKQDTERALVKDLPDLLAEGAKLTREWAPRLCCRAGPDGPGCEPYHAAWTTLRWLGSITGARTDQDFFLERFSAVASALDGQQRQPRVLICGTADHAMLEMVLQGCRQAGREPAVTVVDACRTTLELNRWYAEKTGATLSVVAQDVRDFEDPGAFDLICTHSILSFVPAIDHAGLFAHWRASLAPGGQLVQVQGVRPDMAGTTVLRLSPAEVQRFVDRVVEDHGRTAAAADPGLTAGQVESLARAFAVHKTLLVVADADRIRSALLAAGFGIEQFTQTSRHGLAYRSSNADRTDQAFSLRVVASATA